MLKPDLAKIIHRQNPHLYQRDAEKIVDAILAEIVAAMARGDRVELRGFGNFSVRLRSPRVARNPRNGAVVAIGKKGHPYFKGQGDAIPNKSVMIASARLEVYC
jgi:integration host factor subunit beta